jgi:nucleotide-binding universal stress UspA family protein
MFAKILLATDFSEASETAKWLTEELVGTGQAVELLVLTVFDPGDELPREGVFLPSDQAEEHELRKFYAEREELLVDYCRALKNRGIAAERRILEGDPTETILRFAREWGAGLIVIGATGKSSAREMTLGKTAEALLKRATVPVLVAAHRAG